MTEAQAKRLVEDMKKGGSPENTHLQPEIPTSATTPIGAPPRDDRKEKANTNQEIGLGSLFQNHLAKPVAAGLAGVVGGFLAANFKRALGTYIRKYMMHGLAALAAIFLLMSHGVGNFFHGHSAKPTEKTTTPATSNTPVPQTAPANAPLALAQPGPGSRLDSPQVQAPVVQAPPQEETKKDTPHPHPLPQGARGKNTKPAAPATGSTPSGRSPQAIQVPPALQSQVNADSHLADNFAAQFYGADYEHFGDWIGFLQDNLAPAYRSAFFKNFFPDDRLEDIRKFHHVETFKPSSPAKLVKLDDPAEVFLVEGTATAKSLGFSGKKFDVSRPVTLLLGIRHEPGAKALVVGVKELAPGTATADKKSDLLDTLGDQVTGDLEGVPQNVTKELNGDGKKAVNQAVEEKTKGLLKGIF